MPHILWGTFFVKGKCVFLKVCVCGFTTYTTLLLLFFFFTKVWRETCWKEMGHMMLQHTHVKNSDQMSLRKLFKNNIISDNWLYHRQWRVLHLVELSGNSIIPLTHFCFLPKKSSAFCTWHRPSVQRIGKSFLKKKRN